MTDHERRESATQRLAAIALSLGALAVPAGAAQIETAHQGTEASRPAPDRLGDLRAQFAVAFTPGAINADDEGGPGFIESRRPAMISE
jgi:hypothetical protein